MSSGSIDLGATFSSGNEVTTINGLSGAVTLVPGTGISITPAGNALTIASTAILSINGDTTEAQTLTVGTSGSDFAIINPGGGSHVFELPTASATVRGALSPADWVTFNNKLSPNFSNYITNPDAEVDTAGWNLYNNSGNTAHAFVVAQDITYTAIAAGNAGNGINIDYVFNAGVSSSTPLVTVVSPTLITIGWNNGPTLANNPTATQLKAAYDAVPGAVALAVSAITGTPSKLQFITGSNITASGGDTAPSTGSGGSATGVTFTRTTVNPLAGIASFDFGKDGSNRQGDGVSTDIIINNIDKGQPLQISFAYQGSSGMTLGANSDVQIFVYDITNNNLIPVIPLRTIAGPVSTVKTFTGKFQTVDTSVSYRLILHIATTSTTAWDLILDEVVINDEISPEAATEVPSLVLQAQPILGSVTDRMVVMWTDGATSWSPAAQASGVLGVTMLGFATNIVGLIADVYIKGYMNGFSFGPFVGFEQYIDTIAGGISPLPSPFTDTYVGVGKAISSSELVIDFYKHQDEVGVKGGLLTNNGANNGNGDVVLAVGANGNVLIANSAAGDGIQWAPAVVAGTGVVYTTATRTLTLSNLAGDVTGAPQTNTIAASTVTGKLITGFVSGAGVVAATDTILQAINKMVGNIALRALAASPTFTGDINSSTGNILVSTIGKGLQVKTGTNSKIGTAVLVAGTVTVPNTSVTANSRIFVTSNTDGGTPGWLRVSAKTVGTSFVITSSSVIDTSTVAWVIIESIP